jgi:Putative zinc-finger
MTARFTPISCEEFAASVADFLERDLDEASRAAVETHALDCDACGALLSDLRRLSVDAANLPELSPSRDLWEGIAARIDAPVIPIGTRGESRARFGGRVARDRSVLRAAAIAASLLVAAGLGAAVMFQFMRDRDTNRFVTTGPTAQHNVAVGTPGSSRTVAPDTSAAPSVLRAVATTDSSADSSLTKGDGSGVMAVSNPSNRSAEQTFDAEITRLRAIVQRRRSQFDPVTISVIERNLKVIDDAIAQCRAALAKDPASRFLIESLNHALENKVELLRTAAMLPART